MPYQDLSVGSTKKEEPSFADKISQGFRDFVDSFSGGNDDPSPAPVSGGRGCVVERPNERNDYLAAILQQQSDNAIVPPPSQPDIPQSFTEFNDAAKNIFREVYNPQTGQYELADNPPSQWTNNRNDITSGIVQYVFPNWRDALMIGGQYDRSVPHALVDNVIGLDDGVVSGGEAFGQQAYDDPLGTLKGMGLGAAEGMYNLVTSPIDTIGGYLGDVKTAVMRDQTGRTADQRLADIATVASILPATKVTQGLGSIATAPARRQAQPYKNLDAQSFADMEARGTQDLRNLGERLLGSDPRYAGVQKPLIELNPQTAPAALLNDRSKKVAEAKKMFEQGASQKEVAEKTGVQRITFKNELGENQTRYYQELPEVKVDQKIINKMKNATSGAEFKSTVGELIPEVNDAVNYLTSTYSNLSNLSEVPVIMDALDKAIKKGASGVYYTGEDKIVLDPKRAVLAIANTLNHELEHAVQNRGNPFTFAADKGGSEGARAVRDDMLGTKKKQGFIDKETDKISELFARSNSPYDSFSLSESQMDELLQYAESLQKSRDFFESYSPFELYEMSPAEVLARGAVPNAQLTSKQFNIPRSAPFNPFFPMTLSERIQQAEKVLRDKNYNPTRQRQMSYEQMSPYAFDFLSGYRPDQLLGPKK